MVEFRAERLTGAVTRIYGIMGEQMYLAEGRDRAALIDTGSGAGDLRRFVEGLTDKPIIVLVTHGHVDHALGAPQFDEAYMSHLDREIYEEHSPVQMRKWYLSSSPAFAAVTESDYIPPWPLARFHDLKDGAIFDLGGLSVETFSCAGHTRGSMTLLLREERTLIAGDVCAFFTMLQSESCLGLTAFECNLRELHRHSRRLYDRVHVSHGRKEPSVHMLEEVIALCGEIKNGTDDQIPYEVLGTKGQLAKAAGPDFMRLDGGYGNILYNPDRIHE